MGRFRHSHKLELLQTGGRSLRQLSETIRAVFDVDPDSLALMRTDYASDLDGITLPHAYSSIRVRFKRKATAIGERQFETVGRKRLEYFRYGQAPNCVRVYDKTAECLARLPGLLKLANPDAEPPSFGDLFGFDQRLLRTRIERQAGGRGIPKELSTFGLLVQAAEFNPFSRVEIVSGVFPMPDPSVYGVAHSLKLVGTHGYIGQYGFQQARAMLNADRNGKRRLDEYREYLEETNAKSELSLDRIVESYRRSVQRQIDGTVEGKTLGVHGIRPRPPRVLA